MMSARVIATLAASMFCSSASAMDLMDLYREAQRNDARYAAAKAQFHVMKERVPQARAGVLPQASVDSDQKHGRRRVNNSLSSFDAQRSNYNARDHFNARAGGNKTNGPGWRQQ